jgi:hypothetical protein
MSLDNKEQKNNNIGSFFKLTDLGITKTGELDKPTWSDIVEKGFSLNKQLEFSISRVVPLKKLSNIVHNNVKVYNRKKEKTTRYMNECSLQLTCKCYECEVYSLNILQDQNSCDCCGLQELGNIRQYNSIFSKKGCKMCYKCAKLECCPGCGWEAGGLCNYCRQHS